MFTFLVCAGLLPVLPGVGALAAREVARDLAGPDCDDGVRALLTLALSAAFGLSLVLGTFVLPVVQFPALMGILAAAVLVLNVVSKWFLRVVGV